MQKPRNYHPWWSWECYKAGFYNSSPPTGLDKDQAKLKYKDFLSDLDAFDDAITRVMKEWPVSCEQFLTNSNINRVAWLGQSSMCLTRGVSSAFKSGFMLLSETQQEQANALAKKRLKSWLEAYENSKKGN